MANTETWGKYLRVVETTTTTLTVSWSSLGESGNVVTDAYWNLELFKYPENNDDLIFSSYRVPLGYRRWAFTPSNGSPALQPGTLYIVKLYANRQKDRAVDRIYVTTDQAANPTPGVPSLNVLVNGRTINIYGYKGSDTTYLNVYINGSRQWRVYMGSNSYYDLYYTGSYNTRYEIKVIPENSWYTGTEVSRTVTTGAAPPPDPPPAPSGLNMYDSGETWASFAWNSVSSAEKYAMEIFIGSSMVSGKYDYSIFGTTKQFTGLSPGITYTAKLYGWNTGGNGTPTYLDFTLGYSRPANFSWDITKSKGRSYTLKAGRFTDLVSYAEFSSFRQRINDFRRYKKLSQYTFSNIGIGTVLSDTLYNQLESAISAMSPPTSTPGQKNSGADLVVLLNGVRNSLNSIK